MHHDIVNIKRLDEGSGIAKTLESNHALYHKSCRSLCNSVKVKRARDKQTVSDDGGDVLNPSPKKLRSVNSSLNEGNSNENCHEIKCAICTFSGGTLHKVSSEQVDENLKEWSLKTNNFLLYGKLAATAADAHAGDVFYHTNCYTGLRFKAGQSEKNDDQQERENFLYDPLVIAQLVIYMTENKKKVIEVKDMKQKKVFLLSELLGLYKKKDLKKLVAHVNIIYTPPDLKSTS